MKNRYVLPAMFIVTSSLAFALGAYVLVTKTALHPEFFITTCGEVLRDIQEHVHFNPDGVLSSLIMFVTAIGVSLTLFQLVKFIASHRRLHAFQTEDALTDNLREIIYKHNVSSDSVLIVRNTKLTAYTIGLFNPKIIISRALIAKLSQQQLEAVVLHELHHLRSRHLLWLLLSRLVGSLFFYIPLIEYLARELRTEFELSADAFVIKKQKTRDHLCNSLAFNLKYTDGIVPHFATSPIEERVESLMGNKRSFNRIGIRKLAASVCSLAIMLGVAFIHPSTVSASLDAADGGVCRAEEDCQITDCSGYQRMELHNFTPVTPVSLPLISSH